MNSSSNISFFEDDEITVKIKVIRKLIEIIDYLKQHPISAFSAIEETSIDDDENITFKQACNNVILVETSNLNACKTWVKDLLKTIKNENETKMNVKEEQQNLIELINLPDFEICKIAVQGLMNIFVDYNEIPPNSFEIQITMIISKVKNTPANDLVMNTLQILRIFCSQSSIFKKFVEAKNIDALEALTNFPDDVVQKKSIFVIAILIFTSQSFTEELNESNIPSALIRFLSSDDLEIKIAAAASFITCRIESNRVKHFNATEILILLNFPNNVLRKIALNFIGYYAQNNIENLSSFIGLNGIQRIVELLEHPEFCIHALDALVCISFGTKEHKQAIVKSNAVPILIKLFYSENEKIVAGALNILGCTAVFPEQNDIILGSGALQRLIELVKGENEKVRSWSLFVLRSMVAHPMTLASVIKTISVASVIPILLSILDTTDFKAISWAASIISWLLFLKRENVNQNLIDGGFIPRLIRLLNVSAAPKNIFDDIANHAAYSLMIISSHEKIYIQAIIDAGGIHALNKMLSHENLRTVYFAITALKIFTEADLKQRDAISEAGVIPNFIKLLNSSDEKISAVAMKAITNLLLCQSKKFIEVVVEAGAINSIVEMLDDENLSTVNLALRSLLLFITKECCIEEIIRAGAMPSLLTIIETLDDENICVLAVKLLSFLATVDESIVYESIDLLLSPSWMTCKHACRILTWVMQNSPDSVDMIKTDILVKIIKLFETSAANRYKAGGWLIFWLLLENEESVQAVIDAGIVPYLVKLLDFDEQLKMDNSKNETKPMDVFLFLKKDIRDISAHALEIIALGNTNQKEVIIQSGAIPLLVKLLKSSNSSTRDSATAVLSNIAFNSTIAQKQVIIDAGALPNVVELLLDSDVCEQAANLLSEIAHGSRDQIKAIIDADAIPSLVKLLDSPDSDARESAAWVLYFIMKRNNMPEAIIKSNALPYLLKHMELDKGYQYSAVPQILVQLTFGEPFRDPEDVKAVVDANAIPQIVKMLSSTHVEVIDPCITTIANIAYNSEKYAKDIINAGALFKILKLFESNDPLICHETLKAIGYLVGSCSELIQILIDNHKIPVLLEFLNKSDDEKVIESIASTFFSTSMGTPEQCDVLVKSRVIPNIMGLLDSSNEEIRTSAAQTFMFLSGGKAEHKQAIIDANVLPKLVALLSNTHFTHAEQCAINTIVNIADGSKDYIQIIIESGALPPLIKILESPQWCYARDAVTAIAKISEGSIEHKKSIINAGAVTPLMELAKSEKHQVSRPAMRAIYNLQNCLELTESIPLTFFNAKL